MVTDEAGKVTTVRSPGRVTVLSSPEIVVSIVSPGRVTVLSLVTVCPGRVIVVLSPEIVVTIV